MGGEHAKKKNGFKRGPGQKKNEGRVGGGGGVGQNKTRVKKLFISA